VAAGIITAGILLFAKKNKNNNIPHLHDNHNKGNPNNKGPNGPKDPFYYHNVWCKSKKDAYERALRDGYGNKPIFDGDHFHLSKMRGGKLFKFGNAHYRW
jgi:hypothetical protein